MAKPVIEQTNLDAAANVKPGASGGKSTPLQLKLFARILRLHRQKLPDKQRKLGDAYIKKEFRDHRGANEEFVKVFNAEWQRYADQLGALKDKKSSAGMDLHPTLVSELNADQRETLRKLEYEARSLGRSERKP